MNYKNRTTGQYLIEYYLPFYYLLSLYRNILVIGLGNALLLLFALPKVRHGKLPISTAVKVYVPFVLWIMLRDTIKALSIGSTTPVINAVEYLVLFIAVFLIVVDSFNEEKLYLSWKIAGLIYSIGLIYHLIQIYLFGNAVHPISIIPGYALGKINSLIYRPCSFFPEPAAFASAMLPLVFLALRRKNFIVAICASIMIVVSTSTVGIALLSVLWLFTITVSDLSGKTKVLIGAVLVGILMCLLSSPLFAASFEKLNGVLAGEGTFGIRIVVGFQVISKLNLSQWIVGTNITDVTSFVSQHFNQFSSNRIVTAYYYAGKLFLNGFSSLIYNYGLAGFLLYARTVSSRFRIPGYKAKALLVVHLASMFGQSTMLNSLFFQTIILLSLYDKMALEKDENVEASDY